MRGYLGRLVGNYGFPMLLRPPRQSPALCLDPLDNARTMLIRICNVVIAPQDSGLHGLNSSMANQEEADVSHIKWP